MNWALWLALLLLHTLVAGVAGTTTPTVPSAPFVDLSVIDGSTIRANFSAPVTDGGVAISSYKVEWDTDPGVQEVQTITTSVYVGPNEIQEISTSADDVPEVQTITTAATEVREVQRITVTGAAGSGSFFLKLDMKVQGKSEQFSGDIGFGALADGGLNSVRSIIESMSNVDTGVEVSYTSVSGNEYYYDVTFPASMGQVPQLIPNAADLQPASVRSPAYLGSDEQAGD